MAPQFTAHNNTLSQVFDFCIAHKGIRGFKDWSYAEILLELTAAFYKQHLYITTDNNQITGMAIAFIIDDKSFAVDHLICANKLAFKWLRLMAKQVFGNRICVYQRRGQDRKLVKYV